MGSTSIKGGRVANKKAGSEGDAKRYGTLIRVDDVFADAIRDAAGFERMSVAEYARTYLLPIVQKRYRDAVIKAAKKLGGDESDK